MEERNRGWKGKVRGRSNRKRKGSKEISEEIERGNGKVGKKGENGRREKIRIME